MPGCVRGFDVCHACPRREVLAVALPRRPLFPGGLMPVTVSNEKLIQELIQLKKGGCAPP